MAAMALGDQRTGEGEQRQAPVVGKVGRGKAADLVEGDPQPPGQPPQVGPQRPAGAAPVPEAPGRGEAGGDRKSTRLNSSHVRISYAVFCLKNNNRWTISPGAAA